MPPRTIPLDNLYCNGSGLLSIEDERIALLEHRLRLLVPLEARTGGAVWQDNCPICGQELSNLWDPFFGLGGFGPDIECEGCRGRILQLIWDVRLRQLELEKQRTEAGQT